ncbi:uncharacterized protein N7469_010065 [Penicillium citrinum]|uniref:Yeast cell wall synthesis Kre9/Knh1-like N-terminal domain-containing protein n=1 Tax=Penicillium citrinum TaxID=5077 RepID=A0A9W9TFV7_PENCI|nr:uncharacterized protein N7469_010065 [Penicillium citrinum]KAJ5221178.1 hypothetical protein N7469_010065 [Penicillium citrinum]
MRVTTVSSLIVFAVTAAGLTITSPEVGQSVDNSKSVTVKWQAVETDPETFSIYLVNQNVYPPTQELVASDVPKDKGSYTIKAKSMDGVDTGRGYQVNIVSDTNQAILAQSSQFKVAGHDKMSSISGKETGISTDSATDFTSATDSISASGTATSVTASTSMTSSSASITATESSTVPSTSPTITHTSISASSYTTSSSFASPLSTSTHTSTSLLTTSTTSANPYVAYLYLFIVIFHNILICPFNFEFYLEHYIHNSILYFINGLVIIYFAQFH